MMAKHRHKWVDAPKWWICTALVSGRRCGKQALYRCAERDCREVVGTEGDDDLTARCREHMPRKRKAKAKPRTWRGWGVRWKDDGFIETLCEELAIDKAREHSRDVSLVRVVAKVTEVTP